MLGRHAIEDAHNAERAFAVEWGGGFVGENDRRLIGQRPGDGDTLLFSAREA